ncbi:MAG: hypothetical protein LCI00_22385 [Chloroflexi bacterium]|nr:hypothetical protein [Chloroflexota bacterium]MCC6895216.1 hypothetical protein [Anaerolineae bacterium]
MNVSSYMNARWARVISNLLSPPMVWATLVFFIAFHFAENRLQGLMWALTYGILVCLMPILYIAWRVRRGKISDIHMKERQERIIPFAVSIGCAILAWVVLRMMNAPSILPLIAAITLVELAVMLLITFAWQISMHAMSISVAVVATGIVFGAAPALAVSPLLPIVGAARLRLERHTLAQVIAGAIVGAIIPLIVLAIM